MAKRRDQIRWGCTKCGFKGLVSYYEMAVHMRDCEGPGTVAAARAAKPREHAFKKGRR